LNSRTHDRHQMAADLGNWRSARFSQWKGPVDGTEGYRKSGIAPSPTVEVKLAERAIDKALAPKKNLQRPE
jgi:hypothetical protein